MNKVFVLLAVLVLITPGCSNEVRENKEGGAQTIPLPTPEQQENQNLSMEERGLKKLNPERVPADLKAPAPTPQKWAFLTADLWHFEFALTVTEVPENNIYEGHWIDFNDDGTYTKGIYDEVTVEGVFTYNNDNKTLRIYPTKGNETVKEWEILTNGDVIIFVGTNTFGNNSEQIKLARARQLPVRKAN